MAGQAPQKLFPGFRLDLSSGVPVYRQIIDQVTGGMASGFLKPGDQLPTVRQLAVDLAINPNTVVRAYRELEIRGILETQQGTGTFISSQRPDAASSMERQRQLNQLVGEFVAKAGAAGYTVQELIDQLQDLKADQVSLERSPAKRSPAAASTSDLRMPPDPLPAGKKGKR